MADAFIAIALAGNIVQFLGLAKTAVSTFKEIHDKGALSELVRLESITAKLVNSNNEIQGSLGSPQTSANGISSMEIVSTGPYQPG